MVQLASIKICVHGWTKVSRMVPKNQLLYLETLVAGILTDHVGAVNMEAHFAKAIVVNCGD